MELRPRTFTISAEQDRVLIQEAAKRQAETGERVSVSEVLREIIDWYARERNSDADRAGRRWDG